MKKISHHYISWKKWQLKCPTRFLEARRRRRKRLSKAHLFWIICAMFKKRPNPLYSSLLPFFFSTSHCVFSSIAHLHQKTHKIFIKISAEFIFCQDRCLKYLTCCVRILSEQILSSRSSNNININSIITFNNYNNNILLDWLWPALKWLRAVFLQNDSNQIIIIRREKSDYSNAPKWPGSVSR